MSDEYREIPNSKIGFRGKMLVAWLAEATPPVLWRWLASDVSSGFGLKDNDGKVDLVRYDGGVTPQTVASFASTQSAEQALAGLSRALLAYRAPWKKFVTWGLATIILLTVAFGPTILSKIQIAQLETALKKQQAAATGQPATLTRSQPAGTAAKQTGPLPGVPTDVDSLYH